MKSICYVLSYYSPDYIRTRTLIKALLQIDTVKLYQCRNASRGIWRYVQSLSKLIITRILKKPDIYILGFRGYEIYWFVRLITLGRPLIFDHMMSPYDSLVNERKKIRKNGRLARLIYLYEKSILNSSDLVLTDTENHKVYFQELFDIPPKKITAIPIGTDEELFHPMAHEIDEDHSSPFEVLFYGSFLPLHGIDIILKSAMELREYPIRFTLIGGQNPKISGYLKKIQDYHLDNIKHIKWVEFEQLPQFIDHSDICLGGPFGNTGQAHRVITSKTFQILAMAKPAVIGETNNSYGFEDKVNCLLVPQGDVVALADSILWTFQNKAELFKIGQNGRNLYQSHFSTTRISETLGRSMFDEISAP